jgi:hypothetical protein
MMSRHGFIERIDYGRIPLDSISQLSMQRR